MNPMLEGYQIRQPFFEGPMDLMLFLIKKKELEITEIAISLITHDFIAYVEKYKNIGHNAIAEFISMAATLLYLKSLSVLPLSEEAELDEDIEDPRKSLVYQLIEYEKLKKMTAFLEERKNQLVLARNANADLEGIKSNYSVVESNFRELLDCYVKFFTPPKTSLILDKIGKAIASVEDKIKWLARILKKKAVVSFFSISENLIRTERIVTFQATLEMAKQSQILLSQNELFGDIMIENNKGMVDGEQEEIA